MRISIGARLAAASMLFWLAGIASSAALPARLSLDVDGVRIDYSPADEAYALELAKRLRTPGAVPAPTIPTLPLSLDMLATQRTEILSDLSKLLALDKPSDLIEKTYDHFTATYRVFRGLFLEVPVKHFAVWRKSDALARMDAGEPTPGLQRDGPGGVAFSANFNFGLDAASTPESITESFRKTWDAVTFPLVIKDDATPAQAVDATLANLNELKTFFLANEAKGVMTVLHEATEPALALTYLPGRDRRWFCDGVANYVAMKVIENRAGPAAVRQYYDLEAELARHAALKDRIDLERWPVVEAPEFKSYPPELDAANYAFATGVIVQISRKYGDDLLPRLLRELAKTPLEKRTLQTVYAAFGKLTGDDLRRWLR